MDHLDAEKVHWDAIIVGAGVGGGTLGYELARAGRRVLFIEKGRSDLQTHKDAILGQAPLRAAPSECSDLRWFSR